MLVNAYMRKSRVLNIKASKRKKKKNYEYNKALGHLPGEIISNQRGAVGDFRLGVCRVKNVGCGAVAIYNALYIDNKHTDFSLILAECEKITMLMGMFGCNSYRIGKALNCLGYNNDEVVYAYEYGKTDIVFEKARIMIAAFWNSDSIFSGAHIVAMEKISGGRIRAYNAARREYESFEDFKEKCLTKKRFIALYGILENKERIK